VQQLQRRPQHLKWSASPGSGGLSSAGMASFNSFIFEQLSGCAMCKNQGACRVQGRDVDSSALPSQPSCEVPSPRRLCIPAILGQHLATRVRDGQQRPPWPALFEFVLLFRLVMYRSSRNHLERKGRVVASSGHPSQPAECINSSGCVLRNNPQDTLRGVLGCMYSSDNAEETSRSFRDFPCTGFRTAKAKLSPPSHTDACQSPMGG